MGEGELEREEIESFLGGEWDRTLPEEGEEEVEEGGEGETTSAGEEDLQDMPSEDLVSSRVLRASSLSSDSPRRGKIPNPVPIISTPARGFVSRYFKPDGPDSEPERRCRREPIGTPSWRVPPGDRSDCGLHAMPALLL